MVVDDDELVRAMLEAVLRQAGHEVLGEASKGWRRSASSAAGARWFVRKVDAAAELTPAVETVLELDSSPEDVAETA
jgi:CheY-like chemotaxis protein